MIQIRRSEDRGLTRFEWLDSRHTFSFGAYRDPRHMGFRALRVVNEDVVAPGRGFGMHPHRDMEILTFMRSGALEHKDSTGSSAVIRLRDVQRMSAGTGVLHSETNASREEPAHLLQVWIEPEALGLAPSYEQRPFGERWQRVASRDGRDGALRVHQDVEIHRGRIGAGDWVPHELAPGRHAWLQVIDGEVRIGGQRLGAGDGAALSEARQLRIEAVASSDVLLFDLA